MTNLAVLLNFSQANNPYGTYRTLEFLVVPHMYYINDCRMVIILESGNPEVGKAFMLARLLSMPVMFHLFTTQPPPISHHNFMWFMTRVSLPSLIFLVQSTLLSWTNFFEKPHGCILTNLNTNILTPSGEHQALKSMKFHHMKDTKVCHGLITPHQIPREYLPQLQNLYQGLRRYLLRAIGKSLYQAPHQFKYKHLYQVPNGIL